MSEIIWSKEQVQQSCDGSLPALVLQGIQSYNAGNYFEAHEELETAWRAEHGPVRDLYHGILQVGLGYYQILRGNYRGAVKMFQRCHQWLDPLPPVCRGVDVAQLRLDAARAEAALLAADPIRLDLFDRSLMRPIRVVKPED